MDIFRKLEKETGVQTWEPFVRIIERKEDAYLIHQANRILVRLVVAESRLPDTVRKFYLGWLRDVIKSGVRLEKERDRKGEEEGERGEKGERGGRGGGGVETGKGSRWEEMQGQVMAL